MHWRRYRGGKSREFRIHEVDEELASLIIHYVTMYHSSNPLRVFR